MCMHHSCCCKLFILVVITPALQSYLRERTSLCELVWCVLHSLYFRIVAKHAPVCSNMADTLEIGMSRTTCEVYTDAREGKNARLWSTICGTKASATQHLGWFSFRCAPCVRMPSSGFCNSRREIMAPGLLNLISVVLVSVVLVSEMLFVSYNCTVSSALCPSPQSALFQFFKLPHSTVLCYRERQQVAPCCHLQLPKHVLCFGAEVQCIG